MDTLSGDSVRRHGVANLARVVAKLDLLEATRTVLLQGHLSHLGLAAVATKLELHDGASAGSDKLGDLIELEDESVFEELGESGFVDKVGVAGDDEDARHASSNGVAAVLDSVVRNLDAMALDEEAAGPRDAEELLGSLGGEEDNLGGGCRMGLEVGVVDIAAPNTADVADAPEKLESGRSRREVGEPKSAVLLRSEVLSTGVGLRVHTVVTGRELGRAGSVGGEVSRKGSRRSLLHHSLHGQEASSRGVAGHLSRTSSRASSGGNMKLVDGGNGNSRSREAEDVNSKRLVDRSLGASRAEERSLELRKIKRRVCHVGSSSHLAIDGSCSSFVVVARTRVPLREDGIARRRTGKTLRVGWAKHVGRRVDSSREASLVSRKGRWASNGILSANESISLVYVGVQRAPASVSSSSRLVVNSTSSSSSGALVEMGRRPDLRRLVAETKTADETRNLAATNLQTARGSVANLVDGRERAGREVGKGAEHRSGPSSRGRRDLGRGNRLSEEGSSLVWSARGLGRAPEAVRRGVRDGDYSRGAVDEVAHLGLLVVALGVHGNEGRGGRGFLQKNKKD